MRYANRGGRTTGIAAMAAVAVAAACSDTTAPGGGPGGDADLTLGITTTATGVAAAAGPAFDLVIDDGAHELVVTRVAVVVREIELELQDDDACDDASGGSDDGGGGSGDGCEEFAVGPLLLEVPLDGSVEQVLEIQDVRPGVYDEVEFEIHKPDDDTAEDLAFIAAHPEFRRVSIRVEGTFDGASFTYLTDLNEEQEVRLSPPLDLTAGGATTVTLSLDVAAWFRDGGGLIDPASANDGGPNENRVRDNIRDSIEGFEDRDRDGRHDD